MKPVPFYFVLCLLGDLINQSHSFESLISLSIHYKPVPKLEFLTLSSFGVRYLHLFRVGIHPVSLSLFYDYFDYGFANWLLALAYNRHKDSFHLFLVAEVYFRVYFPHQLLDIELKFILLLGRDRVSSHLQGFVVHSQE